MSRITLLLIGLILLGFALRIYGLDSQSLRGDEAASANYASLTVAEVLEISRVADPHPPLFYLALGLWEALAGFSEFAVRWWVLMPALLSIPSIYVLARDLLGQRIGLIAAFLLAINGFHIWHSQDARSYTWFVLGGIGSSLWLLHSLRRGRWFDWVRYGLIMATLFYVHYYSVFLVIFHGLYVLWFANRSRPEMGLSLNRMTLKWSSVIGSAFILFLPWLQSSWHFITSFRGDFDPAFPHVVLWRGLQAFISGEIATTVYFSPSVIASGMVIALGIWSLWRRQRNEAIFLSLYFSLPFLGIMALALRGQAFTERYLLAALPAFLIILASGIIAITQWPLVRSSWHWPLLSCILLVILWLNLWTVGRYQVDHDLAKSPEWQQVFDYIAQHQNSVTDLLLYNFPEASVTYYLDTKPAVSTGDKLLAILAPPSPNPDPDDLDQYLAGLLRPYQHVWFVPINARGWDEAKGVETWLTRYSDRVATAAFRWIRADRYLTPAEIDRTMHQQQVNFANGITLRGFQVFNTITEAHQQVILDNEPLDLSLYWTTEGPTNIALTVFTQLIDETGFFRGGQDNQPVWGSYPTTTWHFDERITDKYQLMPQADAPSGDYQVWVGFYNPQTGERVMVVDEAGQPIADHIVLEIKVRIR